MRRMGALAPTQRMRQNTPSAILTYALFATQPAGRALATEDIAARARAITVRVDCLK